MSFRKPFQALRESAGAYVQGVYVAGARSVIDIQASIQPVSGQDMITAPEGRRISDMVKIYTDASLQESAEASGLQPDLIVWRGYAYEIVSIEVRQMSVIDHYKVMAVRRMPVPNDYPAQWLSGALKRGAQQ